MPKGVYQRKPKPDEPGQPVPVRSVELVIQPASVDAISGALIPPVTIRVPLTEMFLTDADTAPIRQQQLAHHKAAERAQRKHSDSEINDKEIGEPRTILQIEQFNLSQAFNKAAFRKAVAAGFNKIQNLRKTSDGWVFEAYLDPRT